MKAARQRTLKQPRRLLLLELDRVVRESGDGSGFDSSAWLRDWVIRPCPALGFRCPVDLLGTPGEREMVLELLRRMQSGAYS